jgi:ABC-type transport system involved in cytochrome bd biosynthesis fused ATPase/permease subunit
MTRFKAGARTANVGQSRSGKTSLPGFLSGKSGKKSGSAVVQKITHLLT